ncbi:MAG: translation initiation factor IF-5A [archaeon]
MEKKFMEVGQLKTGNYVLIDDVPCKIIGIEKSKPGKHGSAKARITAVGVFVNQKKTLMKPTSAGAESPIIEKSSAQVIAKIGDKLQLMDLTSYATFDVLPDEEYSNLAAGTEVEYIKYGSDVKISRLK